MVVALPSPSNSNRQMTPYALLVPAAALGCNSHEPAADLACANFPAEDRRNLVAAIRRGRKALKSLRNPWG
jgi:hypothetical protein